MKKRFMSILILTLALIMGFALVACVKRQDNNNDDDDDDEVVLSYQLIGEYTELASFGFEYYFLMEMFSDGTFKISQYNAASYDDSAYEENKSFIEEFAVGIWKKTKDLESQDCIQIKITGGDTYYAYEDDGILTFADYTFPLGGSFTRQVTLTGTSEKVYESYDDFISAYKKVFIPPESIATFTDAESRVTAYLNNEGEILIYLGYTKVAEGVWDNTDGELSITINENPLEITVDGDKASFEYAITLGGQPVGTFIFVCEDITDLLEVALPVA